MAPTFKMETWKMPNNNLVGKKEILSYTRRSWKTVKAWIIKENFPAMKLDGVWESSGEMIDDWKKKKILQDKSRP